MDNEALVEIETLKSANKIIVNSRCQNAIIEFNNYVWKKDKDTDKLLNEPIDEYNHLMDALRYATEGVRVRTFRF